MSDVTPPQAAPGMAEWPPLSMEERRVLGVLVEKAKTTPDAYPLSLNGLVTGSNQKSNREPLLNLSEQEVVDALRSAQHKGLASRITGGRVERWRHLLYETWKADKVELAVLAELLLRGPQTEGELRGRASRMEPIDDLDRLRDILGRLKDRRLVVYLTPEGRRGTLVTHGFHEPAQLERLRHVHACSTVDDAPLSSRPAQPAPPATSAPVLDALLTRLDRAEADLATARGAVADLRTEVSQLREEVNRLKQALGA